MSRILKIINFSILICFFSIIIFTGCAGRSSNLSSKYPLPDWVLNPSVNGVIGGVGYCPAHVKGISGQRELAVTRAVEDIARQKGVSVESSVVVISNASNKSKVPVTNINSNSTHKTKNYINAYIKEIWVHPVTKEMYVYMLEVK